MTFPQMPKLRPVGVISPRRGADGLWLLRPLAEGFAVSAGNELFARIDGQLVPFRVEWVEDRAASQLLRFSEPDFGRLKAGMQVFAPAGQAPAEPPQETRQWQQLVGFTVVSQAGAELGTIESVDCRTANVLLMLRTPKGGELMLPAAPQLLLALDARQLTLTLNVADGLDQLNK